MSKRRASPREPQRRRRRGSCIGGSPAYQPAAVGLSRSRASRRERRGTPCRAARAATCSRAQTTKSKRAASNGSQPHACVASTSVQRAVRARPRPRSRRGRRPPVGGLHGAERDEVDAAVDRLGELRRPAPPHCDAARPLREQREQHRGEVLLRGEHPRAGLQRGRDHADERRHLRPDRDVRRPRRRASAPSRARAPDRLVPAVEARAPVAPLVLRGLHRLPRGPRRQAVGGGVQVRALRREEPPGVSDLHRLLDVLAHLGVGLAGLAVVPTRPGRSARCAARRTTSTRTGA